MCVSCEGIGVDEIAVGRVPCGLFACGRKELEQA